MMIRILDVLCEQLGCSRYGEKIVTSVVFVVAYVVFMLYKFVACTNYICFWLMYGQS